MLRGTLLLLAAASPATAAAPRPEAALLDAKVSDASAGTCPMACSEAKATGKASTALGSKTEASGDYSFASGDMRGDVGGVIIARIGRTRRSDAVGSAPTAVRLTAGNASESAVRTRCWCAKSEKALTTACDQEMQLS